jgi:hypothetical protein
MTHRTPFVPPDERAHSIGATGGLPGANADPRTAETAPEDIESTVAAGDPPGSVPDPAEEVADLDHENRAAEVPEPALLPEVPAESAAPDDVGGERGSPRPGESGQA